MIKLLGMTSTANYYELLAGYVAVVNCRVCRWPVSVDSCSVKAGRHSLRVNVSSVFKQK